MRLLLTLGFILLLTACGTTLPQEDSAVGTKKLSASACSALGQKVEAARKTVAKCTRDSDCATDADEIGCSNGAEFYNKSANISGFKTYRDNYYASCSLKQTLQCTLYSGNLGCRQGYCAEIPQ